MKTANLEKAHDKLSTRFIAKPLLVTVSAICVAAVAAPQAPNDAQGGKVHTKEEALRRVEQLRVERQLAAKPIAKLAPFFSIHDGYQSTVFLMNMFNEQITAHLAVRTPTGVRLPLGPYAIAPRSYRKLDLNDLLATQEDEISQGSLEISYLGDSQMLSAWVVLTRDQSAVEYPLVALEEQQSSSLVSFWDSTAFGGRPGSPAYYLLNPTDEPVSVVISVGLGDVALADELLDIDPWAVATVLPYTSRPSLVEARKGWIRVGQVTPSGAVLMSGLHVAPVTHRSAQDGMSEANLRLLPVVRFAQMRAYSAFHAIRVPTRHRANAERVRSIVTLFNTTSDEQSVDLSIQEAQSSNVLAEATHELAPGEVKSVNLVSVLGAQGSNNTSEVRVGVTGTRGTFLVAAVSEASGRTFDVTFFARETAHQNGSYPLPNLEGQDVFTTLVNVGDRVTRILAQIFWEARAYALAPIVLGPGEAHRVDFRQLAQSGEADPLGRRFAPDYKNAYFQWTAQRGAAVIARTEVRALEDFDSYGFNCNACCPEHSFGEIVPSTVSFDITQVEPFTAGEFVSTCTGVLGPYSPSGLSLSSPFPFSWNGANVSAVQTGESNMDFSADGEAIFNLSTCQPVPIRFSGTGFAEAKDCQTELNPGHDPSKSCAAQQPTCGTCGQCCLRQRNVGNCLCQEIGGLALKTCLSGQKSTCIKCAEICEGSKMCTLQHVKDAC